MNLRISQILDCISFLLPQTVAKKNTHLLAHSFAGQQCKQARLGPLFKFSQCQHESAG